MVIIATCYSYTGVEGLEGSCHEDMGEDTSPETTAGAQLSREGVAKRDKGDDKGVTWDRQLSREE